MWATPQKRSSWHGDLPGGQRMLSHVRGWRLWEEEAWPGRGAEHSRAGRTPQGLRRWRVDGLGRAGRRILSATCEVWSSLEGEGQGRSACGSRGQRGAGTGPMLDRLVQRGSCAGVVGRAARPGHWAGLTSAFSMSLMHQAHHSFSQEPFGQALPQHGAEPSEVPSTGLAAAAA